MDSALPLIQYHASLLAPAWGPHPEPMELEGVFLRVRTVDVREELGEPWVLTIEVTTDHPQFDPSRLAGAEFDLHMIREDAANPAENDGRFFHGIVLTTEYVGSFAEAYHARLIIGPALSLLGHTKRSRIFQDQSVVEIAQDVVRDTLTPRGGELDVSRLARDYPARDYCVQYEESDLRFMQRVLAEEGITIAFEADASGERTVLYDDHGRFGSVLRAVEGLDGSPAPQHVPVRGDRGELADLETIAAFAWRHRVVPAHGELEQWDWKQASPGPLGARVQPEVHAPRFVGERYAQGGRRLQEEAGGDGPHMDDTADRLERSQARLALDASVFDGLSNVLSMTPGATFELDGHPDTELNGPYYCLRVSHQADGADVEDGGTEDSSYDNRFLCASIEQPFAPAALSRPRVYGVQTATVVGPSGEEIHTDEYGRIKVRMHWDREQRDRDDDTSCWLRVVQSWGGAGFGTQFIPRVGMEVLVNFLDGDPDRPVCVGSVYNGRHMPPYVLPGNKTQSGIKTQSTPGGDGFNELRFDDAAGQEEVYFHAQRDHNERVEHAHSQSVGATQNVSVGSDQSVSVGGSRVVDVTGDQTITVGAPPPPDGSASAGPSNHALSVQGDITVTSELQNITITAPQSISLECGGTSIVLTPTAITLVAGNGTRLDLHAGLAIATAGAGVAVDMDQAGKMSIASIIGSSIAMDDELRLTSGSQSVLDLSDKVLARSSAGASVELTTDAAVVGGSVIAQGSAAKLEIATGIEGSGGNISLGAGPSTLELTATSAKLCSPTVELTGMGAVNIGAPNVKIN